MFSINLFLESITSETQIILALTLLLLLVLYCVSNRNQSSNFPPGPRGFPIIGFLPSILDHRPLEILDGFSKKYGDVFSIKILGRKLVVLNSYEAVRAAYVTDGPNFSYRPDEFNMFGQLFNHSSMNFRNGEEWRNQRRVFSYWIKGGPNQDGLENTVSEAAISLVDKVRAYKSTPFDIYPLLAFSIIDVISSLVCGENLATNQPEIAENILEDTRSLFQLAPGWQGYLHGRIVNLILNPFTKQRRDIAKIQKRQFEYINRFVTGNKATLDANNPRDYIDGLLIEDEAERVSNAPKKFYGMESLHCNILMFYGSGTDTTSSALYFAIFYMAKYPDIQAKLQDELDSKIGSGTIRYTDRKQLPYAEAVVNEVLRNAAIAGLPQPRSNLAQTTLLGYDIPAGTQFLTNLWSAGRDSKYFANPNNFDPANFFERDVPRDICSIPFSAGKRNCPGESLERLEFFVLFTTLFQQFSIAFPENSSVSSMEKVLPGLNRVLIPFNVIATPRF